MCKLVLNHPDRDSFGWKWALEVSEMDDPTSNIVVIIVYFYRTDFLDASSHLYKRVCPSVGQSVGPSVDPSVGNAFF